MASPYNIGRMQYKLNAVSRTRAYPTEVKNQARDTANEGKNEEIP